MSNDDMRETVTTYEPDNAIKNGYRGLLREVFRELMDNRWLMYQLVRRNIFAVYKQSLLGFMWAFIIPLISLGTFIVLNRAGVLAVGEIPVPYPLYALLALALWQIFATGIVAGTNSLVAAGGMLVKINFCRKALVVAAFGPALVSFVIQIAAVLILFAVYGIAPGAAIVALPVAVLPVFLLALGLSFLLSIINGILRDVGTVLSSVIAFLLLLTPILYAVPKSGFFRDLSLFNPMYYLITVPRELILFGASANLAEYAVSYAFSILVFVVCVAIFHLTETRITERV